MFCIQESFFLKLPSVLQNENDQKSRKNDSDSGEDEYSDMALNVGSSENSEENSMR